MMKKYVTPFIQEMALDTTPILAGSYTTPTTVVDEFSDEVQLARELKFDIWGDEEEI